MSRLMAFADISVLVQVGVQSYPTGKREILPESSFRLVDRAFVRGDFCKREQDDIQSGVVLNVKVEVKVQHAITMQTVDQWFDKDEFRATQPLSIGDIVLYDDWVGQASGFTVTVHLSQYLDRLKRYSISYIWVVDL